MLNFFGLSDIILQCDPEPTFIKWGRKLSETVARTSATNAGSNARTHTIQTI